MSELLTHTQADGVSRITMDDGRVNALGQQMLEELHAAVDAARDAEEIILLTGREGFLTAGFDLKLAPEDFGPAVGRGGELAMKLAEHNRPVLIVATGHAIAMGSLLLLSADFRIGVEGEFRYGLNEAMIGLTLPKFAVALADHRLARGYHDRVTLIGEFFGPEEAREAGFLDRVAPAAELEAQTEATLELLKAVKPEAHVGSKALARRELLERMHDAIDNGSGFDW